VAPARSKRNVVIGGELLEASKSNEMQDAFEARKMRHRARVAAPEVFVNARGEPLTRWGFA
jgi:hypothetical protein